MLYRLDMSFLLKSVSQISSKSQIIKVCHYGAGAVKDAVGAFAKKDDSEENTYFYNFQKKQLDKLKGNSIMS